MKKLKITASEYKGLVGKLCRDIANSEWRPDYIVGITRGGLIPAVMISHYFDIPMETLKISLRDGGGGESNLWMSEHAFGYIPTDQRPQTDSTRWDPAYKKNILIVDDINDSGATLNWLINDWQQSCLPGNPVWSTVWNNNVRFAVIVDNLASQCQIKMDYSGIEINKQQDPVWIDFPYELWWHAPD